MIVDEAPRHDPGAVGFVLHVFVGGAAGRFNIKAIGKLRTGQTFLIKDDRESPSFYTRTSDTHLLSVLKEENDFVVEASDFSTMDGETVSRLAFSSVVERRKIAALFEDRGIRTYEADVNPVRQFLMNRSIQGAVRIQGPWRTGVGVDRVYVNPDLAPTEWEPELAVVSIDIETDARASEIYAVSLVGQGPEPKHSTEEVHLVGEPSKDDPPYATCYPDEPALLNAFCERMSQIDPDVVTGWNVIDFDLQVLQKRFKDLKQSFSWGRTNDGSWYRKGERWSGSRMTIHGRQVIDAMRLVRALPDRFDDYRLSSVAKQLLGRDKTLEADDENTMPEVILRAYREDRRAFCDYCLEDSRLVRDILSATGLMKITLRRSLLTGLPLEGAWGSVAAFDFLYISALHRRRIIAPTLGVDRSASGGAPGGLVMAAKAGLYRNIFVFDFKSLYPSIIRTLNIDPLTHIAASKTSNAPLITAPNGASFATDPGILPAMLDEFFSKRDEAKRDGDELASFTYKIVMNSFYGVLASPSCRFSSPQLAGAITEFGHYILRWIRDLLESEGGQVLYGDTDSVFVDANLPAEITNDNAMPEGERLCRWANERLAEHIAERFDVESRLELEFEKLYSRFLLPPSRGDEARGRAKGYAGLRVGPHSEELEIIGMEAVRRDWTDLAHDLQRDLLNRLFHDEPADQIEAALRNWIRAVRKGEMDEKLVYRKALRKNVSRYTKSSPPHVKAARLLPKPSGLIRYVITEDGPQPVGRSTSPIDYRHYVDKQILPIAGTISQVFPLDVELVATGQLSLFNRES